MIFIALFSSLVKLCIQSGFKLFRDALWSSYTSNLTQKRIVWKGPKVLFNHVIINVGLTEDQHRVRRNVVTSFKYCTGPKIILRKAFVSYFVFVFRIKIDFEFVLSKSWQADNELYIVSNTLDMKFFVEVQFQNFENSKQ